MHAQILQIWGNSRIILSRSTYLYRNNLTMPTSSPNSSHSSQSRPVKSREIKFRPVLTHAQLTRIVDLSLEYDKEIDASLRKSIVPMLAKIEVGAINPAY